MGLRSGRTAALVAVLAAVAGAASAAGGEAISEPRLERVVSGLREPVYAVAAPSGRVDRLYVVERTGRVRIVDGDRVLSRPFLDLRSRVATAGYRGLLSLAFHPRYAANGRFYVHYVGRNGDIYVDELRARGGLAVLASRRTVLHVDVQPGGFNHYGGQLAFGRDGRLYASFGEALDRPAAQRPDTFLGKLVRIDVDRPGATGHIVAYGLRNPWRFSFDRATGDIYIGDVGDELREEINRLPKGFVGIPNYGWDIFEGRVQHRAVPPELVGTLVPPLVEYRTRPGRCDSVVGGYVYRGGGVPSLRGRYVYGDFCGGVWSVRVDGGRATDRRVEQLAPGREPFVSFGLDARGELLLVTLAGNVYRVV